MMKLKTLLKLHSVRWSVLLGTATSVLGVLEANHVAIPNWITIATGIATALVVPIARNISQPSVTGNQ